MKRWICCLIVACFVLGLLAGCAKSAEKTEEVTTTEETTIVEETIDIEEEEKRMIPPDAIFTTYTQSDGQTFEGWYAFNENGEIYGTVSADDVLMEQGLRLDLFLCLGDHGKLGFARESESSGLEGTNMYENYLIQMTEGRAKKQYLYESDGKTVVDTFSYSEGVTDGSDGLGTQMINPITIPRTSLKEPYGIFEMKQMAEDLHLELDLIMTDPWMCVLGGTGLMRQSELGQEFESREAFEAWLSTQKGNEYIKVYNSFDDSVRDLLRLGKNEPSDINWHETAMQTWKREQIIEVQYLSDDAAVGEKEKTGYIHPHGIDDSIETAEDFYAWVENQTTDTWVKIYDEDGWTIIDAYHILPDNAITWTVEENGVEKVGWYAVNKSGLYYGNAYADTYLKEQGIHASGLDLEQIIGKHMRGGYRLVSEAVPADQRFVVRNSNKVETTTTEQWDGHASISIQLNDVMILITDCEYDHVVDWVE